MEYTYKGVTVPLPDDLTDDELNQTIEAVEARIDGQQRDVRVQEAAEEIALNRTSQGIPRDVLGPGIMDAYDTAREYVSGIPVAGSISRTLLGTPDSPSYAEAILNEFGRNFLWDVPVNLRAAATPNIYGTQDVYETRDAYRAATDLTTERSGLPQTIDDLASLWGVLAGGKGLGNIPAGVKGGGGLATGKRVGTAGGVGAVEGAAAGALESEATDLSGVLEDAVINAALGGTLSSGGQGILEMFGTVPRAMFGDAQSAERYRIQSEAGLQPTVGSVGGPQGAFLENTIRDAPFSLARVLGPFARDIRSTQDANRAIVDNRFAEARADVSPETPMTTQSALNPAATGAVQDTRQGIRENIRATGEELVEQVGPATPVKIRQVEEVPANLGRDFRGRSLINRAQSDVDELSAERARGGPVNTQLGRVLGDRLDTLRQDADAARQRVATARNDMELAGPGSPAFPALQRRHRDAKKELGDIEENIIRTQRRIRDNTGPPFRAVQDWRTGIGTDVNLGGLRGYEKNILYAPASRAMEGASQAFAPLNQRLSDLYADDKVIGDYFKGSNAATKLESAFKTGQLDVLDNLEKHMDADDWASLRGSIIHRMGISTRKKNPEFSDQEFLSNWSKLSDDVRTRLAGTPEKKVVFDEYAKLAASRSELVDNFNTSRSAPAGGILATLAVSTTSMARFIARTGVSDLVVASEALAKAVAGEPTELAQLLRRLTVAYETRGPDREERSNFPEMRQDFQNLYRDMGGPR